MRGPEELFALTLTDAINEVARQGWEYVRAEHLPAESPRGWFRGATAGEQTVLVFRRARETLGPRLAAVRPETADDGAPMPPPFDPVPPQERAVIDRMQQSMRFREPPLRLEPLLERRAAAADAAASGARASGRPPTSPDAQAVAAGEVQRQRVHAAADLGVEHPVHRAAALDPAERRRGSPPASPRGSACRRPRASRRGRGGPRSRR